MDDGDEVTIYLGNFTHVHIGSYDDEISQDAREKIIAESVIEYLEDIFADRIVVWGGPRSGGCERRDKKSICTSFLKGPNKRKEYVWSGPA